MCNFCLKTPSTNVNVDFSMSTYDLVSVNFSVNGSRESLPSPLPRLRILIILSCYTLSSSSGCHSRQRKACFSQLRRSIERLLKITLILYRVRNKRFKGVKSFECFATFCINFLYSLNNSIKIGYEQFNDILWNQKPLTRWKIFGAVFTIVLCTRV